MWCRCSVCPSIYLHFYLVTLVCACKRIECEAQIYTLFIQHGINIKSYLNVCVWMSQQIWLNWTEMSIWRRRKKKELSRNAEYHKMKKFNQFMPISLPHSLHSSLHRPVLNKLSSATHLSVVVVVFSGSLVPLPFISALAHSCHWFAIEIFEIIWIFSRKFMWFYFICVSLAFISILSHSHIEIGYVMIQKTVSWVLSLLLYFFLLYFVISE